MSPTLRAQSEWFKSQKHAELMQPGRDFQVVETKSGRSVFFSIGSDNVLYASREMSGSQTGWTLHNPNQDMIVAAGLQASGPCTVTSFAVYRNAQSGVDLAAILSSHDRDHLMISLNHENTDDAWTAGIKWRCIPYDCANRTSASIKYNEVQLLGSLDEDSSATIVVDCTRAAGSITLDRYYVIPDVGPGTPLWNLHELPIDLEAGKVESRVGRRSSDPISGLYTYGQIANQTQLIYATLYNYWDSSIPPTVARLIAPFGVTSISTAAMSTAEGTGTALLVAASDGISLYAPDNQDDAAKPLRVLSDPMTYSSTDLRSHSTNNMTAVWGVAVDGKLWYSRCPAGKETDPAAWITPIPILDNVQNFAFYVGDSDGGQTLFAHVNAGLVAMVQDTVTWTWRNRIVALPSLDVHEMIEFDGTTTRIVTYDPSTNLPQAAVDVSIRSVAVEVAVYVNNIYHVLQPATPLVIPTDVSGSITIEQPVESTAAISYQIGIDQGSVLVVNPASPIVSRLAGLTTDQGLKNGQVKDPFTGQTRPLVPSSVSSDDRTSAASVLATLHDKMKTLPEDGSKAAPSAPPPGHSPASFADAIRMSPGEFFAWAAAKIREGFKVVIEWADGFWHAVIRIAGKVWHAALDCLQAVGHAIVWVIDQIKVAIQDFIAYLSFLFEWQDIVRTHKVLKAYWDKWTVAAIDRLEKIEHQVDDAFNNLEAKVAAATGLQNVGSEPVGKTLASASDHGDSPQAHWSIQHFQNGLPSSSGNAKVDTLEGIVGGAIVNLLERVGTDLEGLANDALKGVVDAFHQLKEQVVDQIGSLSIGQIAARVSGIVIELILKEAQNIIVKGIDIFRVLVSYVVESLGQTINIPILSPMYKKACGSDLSIVDLLCLVGAVPATILCKLVTGHAPFDDRAVAVCQSSKSFAAMSPTQAPSAKIQPHVALVRAQATEGAPGDHEASEDPVAAALIRSFNCITDVTGGVGAILFLLLSDGVIPIPSPVKLFMGGLRVGAFFLFITPNINSNANPEHGTEWPWILDQIVTDLNFGKVCFDNGPGVSIALPTYVDKVGPIIDSILNLLWMTPAIGKIVISHSKHAEQSACAGSLLSDIAGMALGVAAIKPPPDKKVQVVAETIGAATSVAALGAAVAALIGDGEDV